MKKLNLGCGDEVMEGYINCDLYNPKADVMCDARNLPFEDNSIDEVYVCHLLEHFNFKESFDVLKEWKRVIKEGGMLVIETPDLLASCKKFVESDDTYRVNVLYGHMFAKPWLEGETHKFLYTETQLSWALRQLGFKNIQRQVALRYREREDICLKMTGVK